MRSLTIQTNDTIVTSGEELGKISFAAPAESDGSTAITVGARVIAQAEGSFLSTTNPTSLVFATASATAAASGKIKISDNGHILPMGNNVYDVGDQNIRFRNTYVASGHFDGIRFYELPANGTNYVGFKAPNSISSDLVWTLPSADGSVNQVLQTNGAGVLAWATAAGGGGGAATIVNSGDNRVLTSDGSTSGIVAESNLTFNGTKLAVTGDVTVDNLTLDLNTIVSSSGNLVLAPATNGALVASTTGNARGANAVDLQTSRTANTQVSSGACSAIGGGYENTASGGFSTVSGGCSNTASGGCSTVSGGSCNTANGTNSTISGGCCNITNARHSRIGGGHRNIIQSPTNECCSRGATISGGVGHNSSGGTLDPNTGDLTSTISCCNAGAFSTIGGGLRNCATGGCSTVSGGCGNTASGPRSTVGGGCCNTASWFGSTVGGGCGNTASGCYSIVGGGYANTASANYSTVNGGHSNTTSGGFSTVSGGYRNTTSGGFSTVSGGYCSVASGCRSTVSGGQFNTTSGSFSTVGGGCCNITNARHSRIGGGHRNIIQSPTNECCSRGATIGGGIGHNTTGGTLDANTGDLTGAITCCNAGAFSTIGGGLRNCATGTCSTVGGGESNTASNSNSTVSGGYVNSATGQFSTVGGGIGNSASSAFATVSGGWNGCASGGCSTVSGGMNNFATARNATVSGGCLNTASGENSTVSGGNCNITNARHSRIGGGHRNIIQSPTNQCCSRGATIGGGVGHNSSGGTLDAITGDLTGAITCCNAGAFSTIGGGLRNCATGGCSTVGGGDSNTASGYSSTVGGGAFNTASGNCSTVSGGRVNTASASYSTVGGGFRGKATRYGETSHAAGRFAADGDAQHTVLIARRSTTDATANQVLFLDDSSARLTIPDSTAWTFSIKLSAYNSTDNQAAWWIFRGGIRRNASNATALVGSLIVENDSESTLSTAVATVVADDTNEALEIRVTGVAAKNIRWVAVADISQVSWGTP